MSTLLSTTALSSLEIEESSQPLFLLTDYDGDSMRLRASDGSLSWEGKISRDELKVLTQKSKMPMETYLSSTLKALTRHNLGSLCFAYSIQYCDDGGLQLVWKKHLASDNIKFQLGAVHLTSASSSQIHNSMLCYSVDTMKKLGQKIENLEAQCDRTVGERREALAHLESQFSPLEKLERDLYGKFKLVLNEKKAKIRKLIELNAQIVEQNEDMQRQLWEMKGASQSYTATSKMDTEEISKGNKSEGSIMCISQPKTESLLGDLYSKPPSPAPMAKRQRLNRSGKSKVEIPHPPIPVSTSGKTSSKVQVKPCRDDKELELVGSVDSSDLLDML